MNLVGFGLLAACTPPADPPGTLPPPASTTDTATTSPPTTGDTASSTGTTGDTGPPPPTFDCTAVLPTAPLSTSVIAGARGSYDLIFDDQGYQLGWDNGLRKSDYYGNGAWISPPLPNVQGMDWLPDGDLAISEIDTDAVVRVNVTTGAVSLISADINAYGLKVGPDGMIYAGTDDAPGGGKLVRIDPATGTRELLIDDPRFNVRSIDFSPDYSKLYMGTYFGDGRFWVVDLDVNLDPIGDAYVFNPNVGNGTEHDAVGVDICGNVFVVDFGTLTMYRLTPEGQKSVFLRFSYDTHYGHGIRWGSGIGGWKENAIYLPEPWFGNTVFEVDVGVPSRSWTP
ncbi:MAG: SMP-30/gluconolactonase/LRE family protein [Myxococcota bacterium]